MIKDLAVQSLLPEKADRQAHMKKYNHTSLRQFSWSGNKEKKPSESLIESTALEWYEAKHRKQSLEEIAFINSIKVHSCPYCGGPVNKNGHRKDGLQRYICRDCKRKSNPLTNTIFDSHKIPVSEWIEYLLHLFEFHSVKTSAIDNRNSDTTGRYWLFKVFEVLKNIQKDVILSGCVYIDEKFLPVIESKKKKDKDGKELKGLSNNQISVATGTNKITSIFISMKHGNSSEASCWRAYHKHIKEGSVLIHDGEPSHNRLVDDLALKSIIHTSSETKGLKDKDNPLDPINDLHDKLQRFMTAHGGYDRSNIQDWLNLFWFIMNGPKDKYDKVRKFIEKAVLIRKRMKFRDVMLKK